MKKIKNFQRPRRQEKDVGGATAAAFDHVTIMRRDIILMISCIEDKSCIKACNLVVSRNLSKEIRYCDQTEHAYKSLQGLQAVDVCCPIWSMA